jgi:type VI secretion system protein ImpM
MDAAGLFGKLPSRGDFVSRRLPREFIDVWDDWLRRAMAESRASLGDAWLDSYLTSPIWRFSIMPGICGPGGYVGLMMPSIDKVGRYFPLTVAARLPDGTSALGSAIAAAAWFDESEKLLLGQLEDDPPDFDVFDNQLEELSRSMHPAGNLALPAASEAATPSCQWELRALEGASTGLAICSMAGGIIIDEIGPISIWWESTGGSGSRFIACKGLPDPTEYAGFLEVTHELIPENWQDDDLESMPPVNSNLENEEPTLTSIEDIVPMDPEDQHAETVTLEDLINSPVEITFSSAARTVAGKVRRENEDAVLDDAGESIWVVADGMGGHASGNTASTAVISAIKELQLPGELDSRVEAVTRALQLVNRQLRSFADHRHECAGMGSTVAVLTAVRGNIAIVWAGDTRVYRRRGDFLEQLTVDHSERQERFERGDISPILNGISNVVTRAVGGEEILQASTVRHVLHPGDRFLICSDGVYEELALHEMASLLSEATASGACDSIINAVLASRARDNASAIVVDATGT